MNIIEKMRQLEKSEGASFSPGYCKLCREQEIKSHSTVLSWELCEGLDLDYYEAHTNACEKAKCGHPFWYRCS